jgi:lipid-A-disaccharide synthase
MVVAYRLDAPTAFIARRLLRTPWITLMNVAAGRAVVPEFIQEACTGEALAAALSALLDDPVARALQIADQAAALALMAGGIADPAGAAAEAVLKPFGQRASSGL